MIFNFDSLVFPSPIPLYDSNSFDGLINQELIFIESNQSMVPMITEVSRKIPCLYLKFISNNFQSKRFILYFHGNAEDLGNISVLLLQVQAILKMNIIAMEYPGYGIYNGLSPSEQLINQDAQIVYNYIQKQYNAKEEDLIVLGRSIGSGPACYISAQNKPKALILISPFTSIRSVAKQHVNFLAYLLKDRFENINLAQNITTPTCIIHGKSDTLINYKQSKKLYSKIASSRKTYHFPEQMTHSHFNLKIDIMQPIINFFECIDDADEYDQKIIRLNKNLQNY